MKITKTIILSIAACMATMVAQAIPAKREAVKVKQPDGTELTICLKGDEWHHFTTTADGYTVVKNQEGYYVYAQKEDGMLKETRMVAHDDAMRQQAERNFLQTIQKGQIPEMDPVVHDIRQKTMAHEQQKLQNQRAAAYDYNNFKGLIILVEFNDKKFSRSDYKDILENMVNQEDYTGYDNQRYTGSVRDYFSDNSNGRFKPQFDIAGPYTVNYSQYAGGDRYMNIINAVLTAADSDINFKDYDGDNNGVVDMIYFLVAGNGANYGGNDSRLWWPHRSMIYNPNTWQYIYKDGVRLADYASSTELAGYTDYPSSVKIDGIGTICHEFSHVLGLPDFYDADYEGSGGQSNDPGQWSVMADGSYENDSRTPVGYSLYERYLVGFIDELPTITEEGDYTLEPLYSGQNGYRLDTPVDNEFFVFENRQKNLFKWDTYLPGSGMLVHRVDHTYQAAWTNNSVNDNPKHNYYELLRADGPHTSGGSYVASPADAFPGTKNVTELTNSSSPASLKTWGGYNNKFGLSGIRQESNGNITFRVGGYQPTLLKVMENLEVYIGVSEQLEVSAEPVYAEYTLTWKSSNESVATVSAEGLVTGISAGGCTITATSNNGLSASCTVTVSALDEYSIAEFKEQPIGKDAMLKLDHAQVLFVYTKNNVTTAYLRDVSGAIMLNNTGMDLKVGNVLTGSMYAQCGEENDVPTAWCHGTAPIGDAMEIAEGGEVQPREITFEELDADLYSDLVLIKGVRLMRESNRIYAYSEQDNTKRARIWAGNFGIASGLTSGASLEGKYFNITAIYGTNVDGKEIINELNITKAVEDVTNTVVGIEEVHAPAQNHAPAYNLSGQKVEAAYKGLVIKNGKKQLVK